jgi:hypothetical protein
MTSRCPIKRAAGIPLGFLQTINNNNNSLTHKSKLHIYVLRWRSCISRSTNFTCFYIQGNSVEVYQMVTLLSSCCFFPFLVSSSTWENPVLSDDDGHFAISLAVIAPRHHFFANWQKVRLWMVIFEKWRLGQISCCLPFTFSHRFALSASLLDKHGWLQSEASSTIFTSISLCYWKRSWCWLIWWPHLPGCSCCCFKRDW